MPKFARLFLVGTVALASPILARAILHWECADPLKFLVYLALAVFAGTLKVRLPGMTGTYSLNFLFVLIGVANFTLPETVALCGLSMAVQSVWKSSHPSRLVHLIFNVSAIMIALATAYGAAKGLALPLTLRLAAAAVIYYFMNTILVSGIVSLAEAQPFLRIWRRWFRWSVVYYVAGVATVSLMLIADQHVGWGYSLLILPVMYLEFMCLRLEIHNHHFIAEP